ncbi:hypothetical protein ABZ345_25815 [Lentzea sp. NPDC005914]|uniref:hypothetical protein n=1 Tax=Lentzea sp. NPDC005914 TaxID=3154572 RepID=UPI0033E3A139
MTRVGLNGRGAVRPARLVLASAMMLVLGACASGDGTGAESPKAAVDTYLAAMNDEDEAALRKMIAEPVRGDAAGYLAEHGGKGLVVESLDITQEFGPDFANAHVTGTNADRSRFDERIVVSKIDDRWYVGLLGPVPDRSSPTAKS